VPVASIGSFGLLLRDNVRVIGEALLHSSQKRSRALS
jgi:hypothetical protein